MFPLIYVINDIFTASMQIQCAVCKGKIMLPAKVKYFFMCGEPISVLTSHNLDF